MKTTEKILITLQNNIRKVPQNYKLTFSIGFIIFALGHKVGYYLYT